MRRPGRHVSAKPVFRRIFALVCCVICRSCRRKRKEAE
ncbi:hypothetical protein I546_1718 [Mycobacterium kansasii 732]|nr:hypothetical protein I546_1718 [Mycobacterium kansasii 732]